MKNINQHLQNLNRKIELLDDKIDKIDIQGGNNVLVSKFGQRFVLDSLNDSSGGEQPCKYWEVVWKGAPSDDSREFQIPVGQVNGVFPDNNDDAGEISEDGDEWIWLEAELDEYNVQSVSINHGSSQPDLPFEVKRELPTTANILLAYVGKGYQVSNFTECGNITIRPQTAFYAYDDGDEDIKPYFTWNITYT